MRFNDTSNNNGIIQHIELLTDLGIGYISSSSTELKNFTAIINRVANRVWHTIFMSNGNWQYDDSNATDFPFAMTNIVEDQRKYILPDTALTVIRVEVLDENDNWVKLRPITVEDINQPIDEFMDVSGAPIYYRLFGNVMEIFPASNYAKTSGLKVYFDRKDTVFTTLDTTKEPGFASPYHEILPIASAIEWYKVKQPQSPTLQGLIQDYLKIEQSIIQYYGKRFKDYKPRISRAYQSYK